MAKNFPSPVWQESWDPTPFGPAAFLVRFSSRAALLQAFRCGVLWGRRFSCSLRPWSFKEGGSPNLLARRVYLRLSRLPLLLRDLASVRALVSGFGILSDPLPDFAVPVDWSRLDVAVLVESLEDVPSFISATLGDARYVVRVEIRGSEQFFSSSSALPHWHEGEPDWGAADDEQDSFLDDVSDPIDLDSDAVEDSAEDPVEDPNEGPGSSSLLQSRVLSTQVRGLLAPHVPFESPRASTFSWSSEEVGLIQSGELSLRLCLSPVLQGLSLGEFSLGGFPVALSQVDFSPILRDPCLQSYSSISRVIKDKVSPLSACSPPLFSSPEIECVVPDPLVTSQCMPLVADPCSCSKPRRWKALLSVKMATAKTVSQKKVASFLPLAGAEPDLLLSWLKNSGFGFEESCAGQLISGIRALEISKSL